MTAVFAEYHFLSKSVTEQRIDENEPSKSLTVIILSETATGPHTVTTVPWCMMPDHHYDIVDIFIGATESKLISRMFSLVLQLEPEN